MGKVGIRFLHKWLLLTLTFFISMLFFTVSAQTGCGPKNTSFQAGEKLTYSIHYNWGAIWMAAGEAVFSVQQENYKGRQAYHFLGTGTSYPKFDWFFKVRDRYEAWSDTNDLRPLRFIRDSHEGPVDIYNDCVFDHRRKMAYTGSRGKNGALRLDSVKIPPCSNDVLTAIYFSRCIDFSRYKPGDTIPLTLVLENKVYPVFIRYIGKEDLKAGELGTFRCIKFRALLIEGTIFSAGEKMTVWVTDDKNRIPVYVETEVLVGSIKAYLARFEGLRNPATAKITQ